MKKIALLILPLLLAACAKTADSGLKLNDLEYFERRGVNVLVYSNTFSGGFNDEKNSGIEIIHHGVRTVQGGAIRLVNTPEQWDLVPETTFRNVDAEAGTIEVGLRYPDYDFDSRIVVTPEGNAFRIDVWLDKPLPAELEGDAGLNLEFLPSQYWNKAYVMDGKAERFPRYAASTTVTRPTKRKSSSSRAIGLMTTGAPAASWTRFPSRSVMSSWRRPTPPSAWSRSAPRTPS